jgi:serine/threonine-protein phosphatase CPPED1
MKSHYLLIWIFLVITIESNSQKSDSFTVIQITDPQFGFFEDNRGFSKETELYQKAVNEVNALNPDFVIITGDLIHDTGNRSQIDEFKRITSLIRCPVYYSPGNHDIGQNPAQSDIDAFIADYGHDRFSFTHKKSAFIGLNSCIIKAATPVLEQAQFEWLEKELKKNRKAKNILVFVHYPFFTTEPDEPEAYFNIPPETRKKYLELFKKYGVDAVYAGHLHNNAYGIYGKMEMITTSAVGKPLGQVPSGMMVINVFPRKVENIYYILEEIEVVR